MTQPPPQGNPRQQGTVNLLTGAMNDLGGKVRSLTENIFGVTFVADRLVNLLKRMDSYQRESIALNKNFNKVLVETNRHLYNFGFKGLFVLDEHIKILNLKLAGVNKNLLVASIFAKATNNNSSKLIRAFAELRAIGGLTAEQSEFLAEQLVKTAQTYGIKTDYLVDSLDSLYKFLPKLNLANATLQFSEGMKLLTGQFGPSFRHAFDRLLDVLLDTSDKGLQTATILGIEGLRRQLLMAQSGEEFASIVTDAIKQGAVQVNQFYEAFKSLGPKGFGLLEEIVGTNAYSFIELSKALEEGITTNKTLNSEIVRFNKSLESLTSQVLDPLQRVGIQIISVIGENIAALKVLTNALIGYAIVRGGKYLLSSASLAMQNLKPTSYQQYMGIATPTLMGVLLKSAVRGIGVLGIGLTIYEILDRLFFSDSVADPLKNIDETTKEHLNLYKKQVELNKQDINKQISESLERLTTMALQLSIGQQAKSLDHLEKLIILQAEQLGVNKESKDALTDLARQAMQDKTINPPSLGGEFKLRRL